MRPLGLVVLFGCGAPDPCADVDLGDPNAGLVVTAESHPGWGREECFDCHVRARLHARGCLPQGAVDLDALRDLDAPCEDCHGFNGLAADTAAEVSP